MKVGIVGAGHVGATTAYALVMRGIGRLVVLVDRNKARAQAEAHDILHAVPFAHPLQVTAGGYDDLSDSTVVILTVGVAQKSGESSGCYPVGHIKPGRRVDPHDCRYCSAIWSAQFTCHRFWNNTRYCQVSNSFGSASGCRPAACARLRTG